MKKPLSNPWWVVVGSVLGLIVGNGPIMQFTFGVFVKPVGQALQVDRGAISGALLIGLTGTALATLVIGRAVDRYGTRAVVLPAIAVFSLSMAAIGAFSNSVWSLSVLYALAGIAAAGQTPLAYCKVIAATFDRRRGLALGVALAGVGIGTAVMPMLAQQLITQFGWRWAYAGLGLITFIVAIPAVAGLVTRGEGAPQRSSMSSTAALATGLTSGEALRSRVFWTLAIAFFAVAMAASGVVAHIVPLMTDRGVPAPVAAGAISAAGLSLIAGRLIAGWLLDRVHGPYVAIGSFALPLVGIGLLLFSNDAGVAVPAAVLVGLGLGAEVDLIAFLQSRYLGLRAFGAIYAYLFAIFVLGSGLGPFVMGSAFQQFHAYTPGLWLLAGGLVLACLLLTTLGAYAFGAIEPAKTTGARIDASLKVTTH